MKRRVFATVTPLLAIAWSITAVAATPKKVVKDTGSATPVLWEDPVDISTRDMVMGPGGAAHQPKGPFRFLKEDAEGTNPKYVIEDANGVKWKLKLGEEAHPETAASRFVWVTGFFADEEYFIPDIKVDNVPTSLHRGENLVEPDGLMHNARLKRDRAGASKDGIWKWKDNPFTGTRELNGLRVLMAVINNWDLKDVNNVVFEKDAKKIYMISDLGATFGSTGLRSTRAAGKGNLDNYVDSKFITEMTETTVSFGTPGRPTFVAIVQPSDYKRRVDLEWIGKDIPIADARWLGSILAKLSRKQIQAAFGAAGYSPKEVVGFSAVVEQRIADLNKL